ncbi:MAG TPA: hypothetical protein VKF83_12790 [Stellaceae bacterium]|nr:hypothetical protein [Stellaceae bacterium]
MDRNLSELLDINKTAHPQAALDFARREQLRDEIERCCPPEVTPPVCTYVPCPAPPSLTPPQQPGGTTH